MRTLEFDDLLRLPCPGRADPRCRIGERFFALARGKDQERRVTGELGPFEPADHQVERRPVQVPSLRALHRGCRTRAT